MWTVVYIAPNLAVAETLKDLLLKEGLLVKLRGPRGPTLEVAHIEILVPEAEVEEAHEILATVLGR